MKFVLSVLIFQSCPQHKGRARSGAKRRHDDGRLIITNSIALEEVTAKESLNLSQPPGSQPPSTAELDEVAVHRQPSKPETSEPVTKAEDEMPLLSAIQEYEDGKKGGESKCKFSFLPSRKEGEGHT